MMPSPWLSLGIFVVGSFFAGAGECDPQGTLDEMIRAKGGGAIKKVQALHFTGVYRGGFLGLEEYRLEELYLLPSFIRSWFKQGSLLGTRLMHIDLDRKLVKDALAGRTVDRTLDPSYDYLQWITVLLIHTSHNPLLAVSCEAAPGGIVLTTVATSSGYTYQFHLRGNTQLPHKVVARSAGKSPFMTNYLLSDYRRSGELMMPTKVSFGGGPWYKFKLEINPPVDPYIRDRLPSADDRDVWRGERK